MSHIFLCDHTTLLRNLQMRHKNDHQNVRNCDILHTNAVRMTQKKLYFVKENWQELINFCYKTGCVKTLPKPIEFSGAMRAQIKIIDELELQQGSENGRGSSQQKLLKFHEIVVQQRRFMFLCFQLKCISIRMIQNSFNLICSCEIKNQVQHQFSEGFGVISSDYRSFDDKFILL